MAYKTCPDCGSRIFEYGCVNCNEEDYITMQGAYDQYDPPKVPIIGRDVQVSDTRDDHSSTGDGK